MSFYLLSLRIHMERFFSRASPGRNLRGLRMRGKQDALHGVHSEEKKRKFAGYLCLRRSVKN